MLILPSSNFAICDMNVSCKYKGVICYGNSTDSISVLVSNGEAPYTYQWANSNSTDSVLIVSTRGTYTVTVTSSNNCSASASAVINIDNELFYGNTYDLSLCTVPPYADVKLNAQGGTGPYLYMLIGVGSDSTGSFLNLPPGNYHFIITDAVGCVDSDVFMIPVPISPDHINFNIEIDSVSCSGAEDGKIIITQLEWQYGPYEYQIDTGYQNDSAVFQSDSIFSNLAPGVYNLIIASAVDDCPVDTTLTVPNSTAICTGVSDLDDEAQLTLYPNPATNLLLVSCANLNFSNGNAALEIYDELGRRVYVKSLSAGETMQQINVLGFTAGFYMVIIKCDNATIASSKFSKL